LYANEFDIQGLIFSSSKHHWKGTKYTPGYKWMGTEWLDRQLDAYAEVYQNLKLHDPDYPSPDYIKSQVFTGNILTEGDMENPTLGSDHIAEILLSPDQTPVWLLAWGGSNTIARALQSIQEKHSHRMEDITQKIRLYLISQQDSTYKSYIKIHWQKANTLICNSSTYGAIAYRWFDYHSPMQQFFFTKQWITENILTSHGALCKLYKDKNGGFRSEGDTPSFLHLINVGLDTITHPEYGGWGGRFQQSGNEWRSSLDQKDRSTLDPWIIAFQNDWAARADWCEQSFQEANHPPELTSYEPQQIQSIPGQTVPLNAGKVFDPDGDILQFRWWYYPEPGSYKGKVELLHANRQNANLVLPKDEQTNGTIHIICEITDQGNPPLTRYQRTIVHVK
jgi:hypothetical protein